MCIDPKMQMKERVFAISQQSNRYIFADTNLLWMDASNPISLAINSLGSTQANIEARFFFFPGGATRLCCLLRSITAVGAQRLMKDECLAVAFPPEAAIPSFLCHSQACAQELCEGLLPAPTPPLG